MARGMPRALRARADQLDRRPLLSCRRTAARGLRSGGVGRCLDAAAAQVDRAGARRPRDSAVALVPLRLVRDSPSLADWATCERFLKAKGVWGLTAVSD